MSFKRMKSLMQAEHVPKYDVSSARAWIKAKILTVLFVEHPQEKASFFTMGLSNREDAVAGKSSLRPVIL